LVQGFGAANLEERGNPGKSRNRRGQKLGPQCDHFKVTPQGFTGEDLVSRKAAKLAKKSACPSPKQVETWLTWTKVHFYPCQPGTTADFLEIPLPRERSGEGDTISVEKTRF